jgi:hypothetical protein
MQSAGNPIEHDTTTVLCRGEADRMCCQPQVKYGPEFQTGVGLENGEFTELINAFLSQRGSAVHEHWQ